MTVPDGRAIYSSGSWIYEFDYKDHLGNTRVSFRANGSALQKTAATDYDIREPENFFCICTRDIEKNC